jgi:class 3 adenylate cyclase/CheY-like chemotaxis protein
MTIDVSEIVVADSPATGSFLDPKWRRAFLAHTRHELRTPLNAIIGYSELVLEELDDVPDTLRRQLRPDVERMYRAGKELLDLVNTLFDPTQIEQNPDFDLIEYRARVTHELRTPLTAAIGYCEMLLEETEAAGDWLRHELQRIHAAGRRLLGLLNILLHEMEMQAASPAPDTVGHLAEGTETAMSAAVGAVTAVAANETGPPLSAGIASARLLVVDDNDMNRDLLFRRLGKQGHVVTTVESGRGALDLARVERFDIILLDVLMPELNGLDTLRMFKADEALRDIPIIMISALDEMDSVVRCIELGAEDYLPKTFDPVLLQARIGACLEKKAFRDREREYVLQIEEGKKRADELLRVILPEPIVQELQTTNTVIPRTYECVAVLFCDVVDFTPYCAERGAEEVISNLQELIERYETLALEHGVQKIKTVGDSFMGTAGLLTYCEDPAGQCVRCALAMVDEARKLPSGWRVRVGIHIGPVVAGVVGRRQYLFDLWGDTVNTAARVESQGADDAVNVSAAVWELISDRFSGVSLGPVILKGKGEMEVFRVVGPLESDTSVEIAIGHTLT